MTDRLIYKVLTAADWAAAQAAGVYDGAPVDRADGFIHFSTAAQLPDTLAKHFAGVDDLVLVAVPTSAFDAQALKWEPSRGGALFPHLYAALDPSLSVAVWPLPLGPDGRHMVPDLPRDDPA